MREALGVEIGGLAAGLAHLGGVIGGALRLQAEAFRDVQVTGPGGVTGVWIALLAGFSQSVGQAFILFVNRVRPLRFALSLLVEAVLFVVGFLAWALSAWLVAHLLLRVEIPAVVMVRALGVAHAPQVLGFLGALPYLGAPWLTLLSLWTAVCFVVGLGAVTGLAPWAVFTCLAAGWLLMHSLQRSAGQPLVRLGRGMLDRAAGVSLVRDARSLEGLLDPTPDRSARR